MIAFFAQLADGGGAGAWVTGFTAIISFTVVFVSFKNGSKDITVTDWITFIGALLAIPLWLVTKNPLWAVILITLIDMLGFYPTFRKGYFKPNEDSVTTFTMSSVKFLIAILALGNYSTITVLYPLSLVIMNGLFAGMLIWRRKATSQQKKKT